MSVKRTLRQRPRWTWMARFTITLLGIALVGEAVARLALHPPRFYEPDEDFGTRRIPGSRVIESDEGYGIYRVDHRGLLDVEREGPVDKRVTLIGDSYSEGVQVPYGMRFSEVMEEEVPGLDVVNVSQSGWHPSIYVARLQEWDLSDTDVIVVQLNDEDLMSLDVEDRIRIAVSPEGTYTLLRDSYETTTGRASRLGSALTRKSALLAWARFRTRLLIQTERERLAGRTKDAEEHERLGLDESVRRLTFLHHQFQELEKRVIYVFIPRVSYEGEVRRAFPESRSVLDAFVRATGAEVVDPYEALVAEFHRSGQPLHGFQNSIMGRGHLNAQGHRIVGRALARALADGAS